MRFPLQARVRVISDSTASPHLFRPFPPSHGVARWLRVLAMRPVIPPMIPLGAPGAVVAAVARDTGELAQRDLYVVTYMVHTSPASLSGAVLQFTYGTASYLPTVPTMRRGVDVTPQQLSVWSAVSQHLTRQTYRSFIFRPVTKGVKGEEGILNMN